MLLIFCVLIFSFGCKNSDLSKLENYSKSENLSNNLSENFQILLHDAKPEGNITEINISIIEVNLVSTDGNILTLSNEKKTFNLIELTKENPLELLKNKIPTGKYNQIRLKLSEKNTIKVNNTLYPLKTPSGQQTGVKLTGAFEIVEGQFYSMTLDFDPNKSIVYTKGTGYILKPVIEIVSSSLLSSGTFLMNGLIKDEKVKIQLNPDGTTKIISTYYPKLEISGMFYYNYETKILNLRTESVLCKTCNGIDFIPKDGFLNLLDVNVLVDYWTEAEMSGSIQRKIKNEIISIPISFEKTELLQLDTSTNYTHLKVIAYYPDSSYNGKIGILSLRPKEGRSFVDLQKISGEQATFEFLINYKYLPGGVPGGKNIYLGKLAVANDINNIAINALSNSSICGLSKLAERNYEITVFVSDKVLTVETEFIPYELWSPDEN
jgi:hypothetical protein